mgnify:FL=1
MKTKYDIGNMVYIPFQIYRIEVSEERTLYIARGYGEEWKHLTVSLTEEEVDMYSIRGNNENPIQG